MKKIVDALLSVVYPAVCPVCSRPLVEGESLMCLTCRVNLPVTGFHRKPDFNPIHERTMGPTPVCRATSWFYYQKESPYTRLIHRVKYSGMADEGRRLAADYARQIASTGFFDGIDLLQPVPLSLSKLITRGYNQSYHIALGIADITGIEIGDLLYARRHSSQTLKNASDRQSNAKGTYLIKKKHRYSSKGPSHILLIDDIITTGATLSACASVIRSQFPDSNISIITLAASQLS